MDEKWGRLTMKKRLTRSMLLLFISVGLLSLLIQMMIMSQLNKESVVNLQDALVDSRQVETASFAKLVGNDLETFRSQIYALYSDSSFKRLKLALNERILTSRYIQDAQYVWSELNMRQFDNSLLNGVTLFLTASGRKVTPNSIVHYTSAEEALMRQIVTGSDGMCLAGGELYLWVPQYFSAVGNPAAMDTVAIGQITMSTLGRYLAGFRADISESNLLLAYRQGDEIVYLTSLDAIDQPNRMLAEIDTRIDDKSGYVMPEGMDQLLTWAQVGTTPLLFCELTSSDVLNGRLSEYSRHLLVYRLLVVLISLMMMALLYTMVSRPLYRLRMALRDLEKGDLSVRLGRTATFDFQYVYDQFNTMSAQIQNLVEQEYAMRLLSMKAELSQLQYQINPHFLYNTYFTLRALLEEEETEKASAYAELLGRYLKYITTADKQFATLEDEINHAKIYAEIQQMRFSKRITLQYGACPQRFSGMKVPKLILQPLIENAFEHGVKQMLSGGMIRVGFQDGEDVVITVEDNGQSLTDEKLADLSLRLTENDRNAAQDSVALLNIHKRLTILFGPESGLSVSRSDMGGLKTTIRIHGGMIDVQNAGG